MISLSEFFSNNFDNMIIEKGPASNKKDSDKDSKKDSVKSTKSNKERQQALKKWLKGKNLHNYVKTLNEMLEDPKAKVLLQEGFGGDLANVEFDFEVKGIPVKNLRPTQSEIDIDKSIGYPLQKAPKNIGTFYENEGKGEDGKGIAIVGLPLITFRGNYIIDGHHRWSQVFALNPDAVMLCCNYDANISPIQMLKATQGAIAAVKADNKFDGDKVPSQTVEKGRNIYDSKWNEDNLVDLVKDVAKGKEDAVVDEFKEVKKGMNKFDKIAEFIADNLLEIKSNNYPESGAPSRGDMPQTDQAAPGIKEPNTPDEKKKALPGSEGSALNKLKDGGIYGGAV